MSRAASILLVVLIGASAPCRAVDDELLSRIRGSCRSPRALIVLCGGDSSLAARLSGGQHLVHALLDSPSQAQAIRNHAREVQLAGIVTADSWTGPQLPHGERLVNVLAAPSWNRQAPSLAEIVRVLQPDGTAWLEQPAAAVRRLASEQQLDDQLQIQERGRWTQVVSRRPKELDAWSHPRHDAGRNAVSRDRQVAVPRGVRWSAGRKWPVGFRKSAVPAVTVGQRQLVYVLQDEVAGGDGPRRRNSLVARDAFNGLLLWKRPASSLQLVTAHGRVHTLLDQQLVQLDAASGQTLRTYDLPWQVDEFALQDGTLLVRHERGLTAVSEQTGEVRWTFETAARQFVCGEQSVILHADDTRRGGESILHAVDLATGERLWSSPTSPWSQRTPRLVLCDSGAVVLSDDSGNHAVDSASGRHRWHYAYERIGHGGSYDKVLSVDGLIWVHAARSADADGPSWLGLDPVSGRVRRQVEQPPDFRLKHRCSFDVATPQLLLCGSMDFADLATGRYSHFDAARNSCAAAGVVPANGLVYTFPHACGCYPMLRGLLALDGGDADLKEPTAGPQSSALHRGPAFASLSDDAAEPAGWPTYRGGSERQASTSLPGPRRLELLWQRELAGAEPAGWAEDWIHAAGGSLTPPVAAGDLCLVGDTDGHRVVALDAASGEVRWQYLAGGRIAGPPALYGPWCVFGTRAGWAYCLRSADGQLAWRRSLALSERRIVVDGQLESPWPVSGSPLVMDGTACFVTGRHQEADGGLRVAAVRMADGALRWSRRPDGHEGVPDVLAGRDRRVQMGAWQGPLDGGRQTASPPIRSLLRGGRLGLLNDDWYQRPIALRKNLQQWTATGRPAAQLLAMREEVSCGYRACERVLGANGMMFGGATLLAEADGESLWSVSLNNSSRISGLAIAGPSLDESSLYVGGRFCESIISSGRTEVRCYELRSGRLLARHELPARPVHDGLAVHQERLYVATEDGRLLCLGAP